MRTKACQIRLGIFVLGMCRTSGAEDLHMHGPVPSAYALG